MNDNNDFDSDWDDEECEWGELEEFDMPGINLDNKILSKRNFAIYDENEIDTIIMNEISNLSKTLGDLDFDEVYHLFIKHEWNTDKVIEDLDGLINNSAKLPINYKREQYTMVGSRSHMSKETEAFFNSKKIEHSDIDIIIIGSSLKLCMVAEGRADSYPRYAPTMEWDTAAGHAIVKFAGFSVLQYNTNKEVVYNKEDLLNPWFLVE